MSGANQPRVLVNGEPATRVDVLDRGFTLGDGLFETIAVRRGQPRFRDLHWARLQDGCRRLRLPEPDLRVLDRDAAAVIGDCPAGVLRVSVTRGPGPRGYAPPPEPAPTRVHVFEPQPNSLTGRPVMLRRCRTRLGCQPALAGLKHLNRLEQVLARAEWDDANIDDGIMQSVDGRVIECLTGNLFLVAGGTLVTPDLYDCGVAGVVRRKVLDTARDAGIAVEERDVGPGELLTAEELFMTNASRGIAPVRRLEGLCWPETGPLTADLAARIDWMED